MPFITPYLIDIINSILLVGDFPKVCKHALITTVPKAKEAQNLSGLRPISILPGISKVVEKLRDIQLTFDTINQNVM